MIARACSLARSGVQRVAALRARTATQTSGRARATAKRRAPFGAWQRLSSVTMHYASLRSSFLALRQNPLRHGGSNSGHLALASRIRTLEEEPERTSRLCSNRRSWAVGRRPSASGRRKRTSAISVADDWNWTAILPLINRPYARHSDRPDSPRTRGCVRACWRHRRTPPETPRDRRD